MDKKKINQFILKWIYHDLTEGYWDELWDSIKKGCIRDIITLDHKWIDEEDYDGKKVWDDFWTEKNYKPFFDDLDDLYIKWETKINEVQ